METENNSDFYVCPRCHGNLLRQGSRELRCPVCDVIFPCVGHIPDFLLEKPNESIDPFLRNVENFGKLATIYETPFWFPLVLRLLGGWRASTLGELVYFARGLMANVQGRILDVATGTGTYGRHIAGPSREVYGIDVSLHMLLRGQSFARKERVERMHFARANAMAMPFADASFDACLLCGSLHIFPNTSDALTEIARTLKSGAPIWITTLILGDTGLLSHDWIRRRVQRKDKMRIFDLPNLHQTLHDTGFEHVEAIAQGSLVSITAIKS